MNNQNNFIDAVITLLGGVLVVLVLFVPATLIFDFVRVNEREVAVITRFGQVTRTVGAGWHYKTPFVSRHSATYDISTQSLSVTMEGTSADQQKVNFDINILYRLDSSKIEEIYKTIGGNGNGGSFPDNRINDYITPILKDAVKSVSSEFSATEQLSRRDEVSARIKENFESKIANFNIFVDSVNIQNINYSTEFNQAIERKVVAQQAAEQKKFELEAERNQLEVEKVKAEQVRIQGEALRANPEVLEQKKIDKWNGVLPKVQGDAQPIIDLTD